MPRRTTNKDMGTMLRKERRGMLDYMYQGGEDEMTPPPPADLVDLEDEELIPGEETPIEAVDELGAEATETPAVVVKAPGEETEDDLYTYEQGENGGWMVYPPGTPCPSEGYKCQLDHPATEEDFLSMEEALDAAGATGEEAYA